MRCCMINGQYVLAVIPARGGSKGLPGKNIKPLCGKPLIAWTIEAARNCNDIDKIIVSTDYEGIAKIAMQYGAEVPFLRPQELAADNSSTIDAIYHAVDWLSEYQNYHPGYILLLQPTSPLRKSEDINEAMEILKDKGQKNRPVRAIVSVCETDHHPWWSNILPEDGCMDGFIRPEILNKRRQDFPAFYRLNGAIYIAEADYIRQHNGFIGPNTFAYRMSKKSSVDIDSDFDFKLAELFCSEIYTRS